MLKDLIIIGAGGVGRETALIVEEINNKSKAGCTRQDNGTMFLKKWERKQLRPSKVSELRLEVFFNTSWVKIFGKLQWVAKWVLKRK